jgi:glycolate oxidase FAD binding subunit
MKISEDLLGQRLVSELGGAAVKNEPGLVASYTVDDKQPSIVCFPNSPEQVTAALRICAEAGAAAVPWGGGTAMKLGNAPNPVNVVIGLNRINRLLEHDEANLTATLEAGMNLQDAQESVAGRKQFLPFDPPHPSRATLGGIVAANLNGPRRMAYGAVRDLVIGMKVALITGEQIKAGGKVVKNVAGYDMCKLFVGSLGTLGIITEVTLRVAPIPETTATFAATGALEQILAFTRELSRSSLLPTAITILTAAVAKSEVNSIDEVMVAVSCEGFEETVRRHLRELQRLAAPAGIKAEVLRTEAQRDLWSQIQNFPLQSEQLVYRIIVPLAAVGPAVRTIESWTAADQSSKIIANPGTGTVWIGFDADESGIAWFGKLIAFAREQHGHAVLFSAPAALKRNLDVWGVAPPSLPLMQEIKHQLDPEGLLNPGRLFIGL